MHQTRSATNTAEVGQSTSLSPGVYWSEVEAAYHLTREEGFKTRDFIKQSLDAWRDSGAEVAIDFGDGRSRGVTLTTTSDEGLICAVRVAEVLGNRMTLAQTNDWVRDQGRMREDDVEFGFADFIAELRLLDADEVTFSQKCLTLAGPYIANTISSDDMLSEEARGANIQNGHELDLRLLAVLDAVGL